MAKERKEMRVSVVSPNTNQHSVHSYFNTSPESPDGRWVLYYTSTTSEGHEGDICIVERATGKVKTLAKGVIVEDAHRVACQQWISQGQRVVFHDLRDGEWVVISVDINSQKERVLARGRQVGWGQPNTHIIPLYGPHWAPGEHRNLELLNVETGDIQTVVTAFEVKETYTEWVSENFGDREISIFFPIISPDLSRVFFKIATPAGGDFRSSKASLRKGLVCYDLKQSRFLFLAKWGHPAWHPNSRDIINVSGSNLILINGDTGSVQTIPDLPRFPASHPSISQDGQFFTTETRLKSFGGAKEEWGIVMGDIQGKDFEIVYEFDNSQGATSWRPSHPHPVFSLDGKRLYFNVSATKWTQLYMAEYGD
ncbi:hypothetical protein ACFL6S_11095 [Candidatus Poribacteria bacterium]